MRKTLAVVLTVFMFACVSPGYILAGSGNGNKSGAQDGSGPVQDRKHDGSCQNTTDDAPLLAGYNRGKRLGPKNGTGPKRNGTGSATCLRA